jgi:CysZ protein
MRRIGRVAAKQLRARHVTTIWIAGILMAVPLSIPLLNLLIPILGAATFTHIFHQLQAREAGVAT